MNDLISKKCVPCEGGTLPLPSDKIKQLLTQVPNWALEEGKLVRRFKFNNFKEAISFVNKVADLAEAENHHPNISVFGYRNVKLTFFTHAINGLSENDFIMAAKVNVIDLKSRQT